MVLLASGGGCCCYYIFTWHLPHLRTLVEFLNRKTRMGVLNAKRIVSLVRAALAEWVSFRGVATTTVAVPAAVIAIKREKTKKEIYISPKEPGIFAGIFRATTQRSGAQWRQWVVENLVKYLSIRILAHKRVWGNGGGGEGRLWWNMCE